MTTWIDSVRGTLQSSVQRVVLGTPLGTPLGAWLDTSPAAVLQHRSSLPPPVPSSSLQLASSKSLLQDRAQLSEQDVDVNVASFGTARPDMGMASSLTQTLACLSSSSGQDAEAAAQSMAVTLSALARTNPDALQWHLSETSAQRQQSLAILAIKTDISAPDLLESFEDIMTEANETSLDRSNTLLSKYTAYISALGELVAKINGRVEAGEDGKSNMHGKEIFDDLLSFCNDWRTDGKQVLMHFENKQAAQEALKLFRSGTVELVGSTGDYRLQFSFSKLNPILDTLFDSKESNISGVDIRGVAKSVLIYGEFGVWSYDSITSKTRNAGQNSFVIQALNLATSDVQKTHQTDLDLLINDFSRSVSQFDNLVKLYSSLSTALTETCKSFL